MNIFPIIQPAVTSELQEFPLFREVKWDYEADCPVWKNGNPVFVEGAEAVAVWAWNALNTIRFRYPIFSWNYGNEAECLIGQKFTSELKQAEAARYVRECVLQNLYISDVSNLFVTFADSVLSIQCTISSIYGSIEMGRTINV